MMTEAYLSTEELIAYYGTNFTEHAGDIAHMPLNFGLIENFKTKEDVTAEKVSNLRKCDFCEHFFNFFFVF